MTSGRTLQPSDEISHYRVVGPLGAGGMGEVYLAKDQSLERSVALKILPPELVRSEERVRRFMLEAKSASSLSHPNIVTIYEIGEDRIRPGGVAESDSGAVHFISMELVSGKTLSTLIHEDRTDLRTLLGYLAQAAEGLAKAHAAGIVHRDLKPGNIMVTADGFAKVLDFGLAKLTERRESDADVSTAPTVAQEGTSAGVVLGTAGYMSPEQVQGKSVDHRSDIFSFGCILYEAATRQRPFVAESSVETMHKILHEKPAPVEELNPKAPAELRRLIRRCLAKSLDQRLQSMKDLAIELREIVDEYETLSASASSGGSGSAALPAASATRGMPVMAIVGIAAIIAVLGIALAMWALRRAGREEQGTSQLQNVRISSQTNRGDITECALSPDGRYLAYLTGSTGRLSLRVRQVATGSDVEVLPESDSDLYGPVFTPDGNYVFYEMRKPESPNYRALYQVPSLGGPSQEKAFDVDSRPTFSPDGKSVCFRRGVPQSQMEKLILVELASGKEQELASVRYPLAYATGPAWSPDGKMIVAAFSALAGSKATFAAYRVADGKREDLFTKSGLYVGSLAWLPDGSGLAMSAIDLSYGLSQQVFVLSYPGRRMSRLTNDLNDYEGVSLSAGDRALATVRSSRLANVWTVAASGGEARQLTRFTNAESSPREMEAGPNGVVLFIAAREQAMDVWTTDLEGHEPRALTQGSELVTFMECNGGSLVYTGFDPGFGFHLWTMNLDGSRRRQLTNGGGEFQLDVSPDGRFVTFARPDSLTSAWSASIESGAITPLATDVFGRRADVSPDSKQVLLSRLDTDAGGLIRDVYMVAPATGGPPGERLKLRLPVQAVNVKWGSDSQSLSFTDLADKAWNVYRQPVAGGPPVPITRFQDGRVIHFEWSRDGRRITLIRKIGNVDNVWITDADGSHPVQMTRFTSGEVFDVDWTVEGDRLLVLQGTTNRDAVLVRNFR
jgi:serine/threonine protein kinase/Tol biopolymer transport system component